MDAPTPDTPAAPPADAPSPPGGAPDEPLRLSRRSYGLALVISIGLFFGLHPIWEPLDIAALDATIWWSYVPIPFLVAGLLLLERRLNGAGWLLDTLSVTFVKFAVTFLAANILWSLTGLPDLGGPESPPPEGRDRSEPFEVRPAPEPTPLAPDRTGAVSGVVVDADGAPVADARVWIDGGLEGFVFAPPGEPLVITFGADGPRPRRAVIATHRPVRIVNEDRVLHAAHARDGRDRWLFTFPVVAEGRKELMFRRAHGVVTLACDLPEHDEPAAELFVADHPFVTRTDAQGRFAFDGVPEGDVTVAASPPSGDGPGGAEAGGAGRTARGAGGGEARAEARIVAGGEVTLRLSP